MAGEKALLDDNQNQSKANKDEFVDYELRMGFRSWRPDWLQPFNSIKWFMVVFCLASLFQGIIVNGITLVSIPSIEKEFGFSSKIIGFIVTGNDVSALTFVGLVSFFCAKGSKPKWMGIGAVITSFGILSFALPKILIGQYHPISYMTNKTLSFDVCKQNKSIPNIACDSDTSGKMLHIVVFYAAQLIIGAGTIPLYTLGPTYVDENVTPRASPMYLGLWFASTVMGPGLGLIIGGLFLKTFTDIILPEGIEDLKANDPRWIGAWWLGYVCFSGIFLLCGFFLILFPRRMVKSGLKRQLSIRDGHLPSADDKIQYTLKGYLKQNLKLFTNKVFMLASLGLAIKMFYGAGLITFITKFLILKFGLLPQDAGIYLGLIMVPSLVIGVLGGSLIIRRLKVAIAAKTAAKICVIITLITTAKSIIFLIPGCNNTNLAGAMVPYMNTTNTDSLSSMCNNKCTCSETNYMPVCGSDGITYHSPCFAGCKEFAMGPNKLPLFGNCSCIQSVERMYRPSNDSFNTTVPPVMSTNINTIGMRISTFFNKASMGKCDRNCKNIYPFIIVMVITLIIQFLASTPHKIMLLRCVPDNQRSFALGTQFVILRSLSFLPAPILLGAIIDSQCITWGYDKCGEKRNCYDYNIDNLSVNVVLLGVVTSVLALFCYALAWWWYPNGKDESKDTNQLIEEEEASA